MFKCTIILSFVACSLAFAVPNRVLPEINGRIVGGEATRIESAPWQVAIQLNNVLHCGGVIYSKNLILTAAHCMQDVDIYSLYIVAGSSNWKNGYTYHRVKSAISHEDYNPSTMENDIAVVRLGSFFFWTPTVNNIPLTESAPINGGNATVFGWGSTAFGWAGASDILRSAAVKIIGTKECRSSAYGNQIKQSMICASGVGKDACQGDTGGALVDENSYLIGIVSWGNGCAFANYPGVYADIFNLRKWILAKVKQISMN